MDIYDPANDTWAAGPPLPENVSNCSAATLDGVVFLVGMDDEGTDLLLVFTEGAWRYSDGRRANSGAFGILRLG